MIKSGRPRAGEERLTREAILAAGLRIVDRDGFDALTMRRLAVDLGVNPMSIYHHLPGKAAVVQGLVQAVFAEAHPTPPPRGAWPARLKHAAHGYRKVLRAHPNLALRILSDPAAVADAII